jgi:uncharacterized membrane protein YhfC
MFLDMDVLIRLLNALLMIGIPVGLGLYLHRRWSLNWRYFLIGVATFLGSQVLHIPFNLMILVPIADKLGLIGTEIFLPLAVYALLLGLSAGLFEEGARYAVYRLWLRDVKSWREAVFFGAGHGGVEAVLLGGLALFAFFQATAYRNADLSKLISPEQLDLARAQLDAYWTAPWYAALMGAVERSLAIVVQISLAVMVFQAVIEQKWLWFATAILWHTTIDALAVLGLQYWGVYLTEGVLAIFAGISFSAILFLRRKQPREMQDAVTDMDKAAQRTPSPSGVKTVLTKDRLDESRYID